MLIGVSDFVGLLIKNVFLGILMKKDLDHISSGADTPLDMTVRHRGEPPSYDQTINNPGYRSSFRTTVINNGVPPPVVNRDKLPSGMYLICFFRIV